MSDIDSKLDRLKADRDFVVTMGDTSEHAKGYIEGLERAIEILEDYED